MFDNKDIQKDTDMALELIKSKYIKNDKFSIYDSLYAFTNENLKGYFNRLEMHNKEILTVAGSGDYIYESLLQNPKNINAFDINKLTTYYINLKSAAIISLNINEFITFFCRDNNYYDVFNEQLYKKIRPNLSEKDVLFWDFLYYKFPGQTIRTSNLFHSTEESYEFLKYSLSYFEEEHYNKLKKILLNQIEQGKNITIDIYDITKKQLPNNPKYDIILLSNIADYLEQFYNKKHLQKFNDLITKNLNNHLNDNGIICAAYLFWAYYLNQKRMPLIERDNLRAQYFKDNFEEWLIDNSSIAGYTKDYLLVYKKQN